MAGVVWSACRALDLRASEVELDFSGSPRTPVPKSGLAGLPESPSLDGTVHGWDLAVFQLNTQYWGHGYDGRSVLKLG